MRLLSNLFAFTSPAILLAAGACFAGQTVIDEPFDSVPADYELIEGASANATASLQIGNINNSSRLIFDGTWDVPANGSEVSQAAFAPIVAAAGDYQVDPAQVDGITSIRFKLDVAVTSDTMMPPDEGVFVNLAIYQMRPDGLTNVFINTGPSVNIIPAGSTTTVDLLLNQADYPMDQFGEQANFGDDGLPLSFGLIIGARYTDDSSTGAFFLDGRLTADNWTVEITTGQTPGLIFADGFQTAN